MIAFACQLLWIILACSSTTTVKWVNIIIRMTGRCEAIGNEERRKARAASGCWCMLGAGEDVRLCRATDGVREEFSAEESRRAWQKHKQSQPSDVLISTATFLWIRSFLVRWICRIDDSQYFEAKFGGNTVYVVVSREFKNWCTIIVEIEKSCHPMN